jgi:hypothetical protein
MGKSELEALGGGPVTPQKHGLKRYDLECIQGQTS